MQISNCFHLFVVVNAADLLYLMNRFSIDLLFTPIEKVNYRWFCKLLVSIHLYIVIFVSLHCFSLLISRDETFCWYAIWAFRRSIFWVRRQIRISMYVSISSILYNSVLPSPFSWDFALTYERFPLTFKFNFICNTYNVVPRLTNLS